MAGYWTIHFDTGAIGLAAYNTRQIPVPKGAVIMNVEFICQAAVVVRIANKYTAATPIANADIVFYEVKAAAGYTNIHTRIHCPEDMITLQAYGTAANSFFIWVVTYETSSVLPLPSAQKFK